MLQIDGRPHASCDGVSRRRILEAAGAGLFGLSLPRLLAAGESRRPGPETAYGVLAVYLEEAIATDPDVQFLSFGRGGFWRSRPERDEG